MSSSSIFSENEKTKDFETIVHSFVQKNQPEIFIATPCVVPSQCSTQYTTSLMQTIDLCRRFQISVSISFERHVKNMGHSKNYLVASGMSNPNITHVLFIDSNMKWNPIDVLKLLIGDKPVIGAICSKTHYHWSRISENPDKVRTIMDKKKSHDIIQDVHSNDILQSSLLEYNVAFKSTTLSVENNLVEVDYISNQFMMIKREVFERMATAFPSSKYSCKEYAERDNEYLFAHFNCTVEQGEFHNEDFVFSQKWKNMNEAVYADMSIKTTTVFPEEYSALCLTAIL